MTERTHNEGTDGNENLSQTTRVPYSDLKKLKPGQQVVIKGSVFRVESVQLSPAYSLESRGKYDEVGVRKFQTPEGGTITHVQPEKFVQLSLTQIRGDHPDQAMSMCVYPDGRETHKIERILTKTDRVRHVVNDVRKSFFR